MAGKVGKSGRKSKAEELGLQRLLDKAFTRNDRLALFSSLRDQALEGNLEATKLLLAYTFGKPTETHNVASVQEVRVIYGSSSSKP